MLHDATFSLHTTIKWDAMAATAVGRIKPIGHLLKPCDASDHETFTTDVPHTVNVLQQLNCPHATQKDRALGGRRP